MNSRFLRTEILIGEESLKKINEKRVAIFGVGGVGGYVCEALVRAGVSHIYIVDYDVLDITNINRQIIALESTIGMKKVDVMKERLIDINPNVLVKTYDVKIDTTTIDSIEIENIFKDADYIIDAIDSIKGKVSIIKKAQENNVPIISAMGAGNKLDPTRFRFCDVYETKICPLARKFRSELKKNSIEKLQVIFSEEIPKYSLKDRVDKRMIGSISFVPSIVGLMIASKVVENIIKE